MSIENRSMPFGTLCSRSILEDFESTSTLARLGVPPRHWHAASRLARQRALSRLLQALFRENLLEPSQLIVDRATGVTLLPVWQQRILLRLADFRPGALGSWTLAGEVSLIAADQPAVVIDWPSELLAVLAPLLDIGQAGAGDPATIERLSIEFDNSLFNDALSQAYRLAWGERLAADCSITPAHDAVARLTGAGRPRDLALTEQWGTSGHPWHPAYKTRLGLSSAQLIALSPEFEARISIGVVAVATRRLSITALEGAGSYIDWFAHTFPDTMTAFVGVLRERGLEASGWLPLPVHPWQREATLRECFAAEYEAGELIDLPDLSIDAYPTMSFRTVAAVGAVGGPMLKLPVSMRLTSVERTVSPKSAVMGPRVSALLERILSIDAELAAVLAIVPERYGLHLIDENDDRARHLSMIVRDNPSTRIHGHQRLLPVGALFTPDFTADMTTSPAKSLLDTLLARQAAGTRQERAARFFAAYLCIAIPAVVGLYLRYGIALEAHQQNTFVAVDETGMPRKLVVRDFGDVKIALPALQARGLSITAFRAGHTTYPDRTIARKKLIHAFLLCHLGELALFRDSGGTAGLKLLHDALQAEFDRHRGMLAPAEWLAERDALMSAPWSFKAFVQMRLHNRSEDMFAVMANPLGIFAGMPSP
ncbi:IucA/IucC family protein [Burkholderia gladioli]|uniref:IucA/IucC family protein n=1 Tax=Burkholderia gladioli TaxID=28095 RepID=UPI001FC8859F|nr:IucA/IucC family protein [Burkholderia gladioli]